MGEIVLTAVLVGAALLIATIAVVSSRRSRSKAEVRIIEPQGNPDAVAAAEPQGNAGAATQAGPATTAQDDKPLDDFAVLWGLLCELLAGKHSNPRLKGLRVDGIFSDRKSRFTLVHAGTQCVIVRMTLPTAPQVRRYVVDTEEPHVWMRSEPRRPAGNDRTIAPAQTQDTSVDGMKMCDGPTLEELWNELQAVYRVGML